MRSQQRNRKTTPSNQRGVVLFVALILLLILSLLGVTAARMQTTEERMARNEDNRQIGAQAAEAALRAAESGLTSGVYSAAQFTSSTPGFYEFTGTQGSILQYAPATISWMTYSPTDPVNPMPALSQLPVAAQSPKFIIENLPAVAMPGDSIQQVQSANPVSPPAVYRITASAAGADSSTTTTLQSIFR
jgi:type IV pilus assembly protein PilX